jgi:Flp pilus assembly pilin Flp
MFLYHRKDLGKKGQGMTEYIIIVALVAIAAIAVVSIFGGKIKAVFTNSGNALNGDVTHEAGENNDLGNYNDKAAQGTTQPGTPAGNP